MAKSKKEDEKDKEKFLKELTEKIKKRTDFTCEYIREGDCIWVKTKDGLIGDKVCHYEVIFHGENEAKTENRDVPSVEVHFENPRTLGCFQDIELPDELMYANWQDREKSRIVYRDKGAEKNKSYERIIDKLIWLDKRIGVGLRNAVWEQIPAAEHEIYRELLAFQRDPGIAKEAIEKAEFKCELDKRHKSFIDKNKEKYMEGHHLIPMARQRDFEKSLDQLANIVCLCPNCHKKIHYGEDRLKLVRKLLTTQRQAGLKSAGLNVTLKKLQSYY